MLDDDPEVPHPFGLESAELAQPCHPMPPTAKASLAGFPPELDGPILLPRLLMELPQERQQLLIGHCTGTGHSIAPGIGAPATDAQRGTQARDAMRGCVSPDERVSHGDSRAKYAAAFLQCRAPRSPARVHAGDGPPPRRVRLAVLYGGYPAPV